MVLNYIILGFIFAVALFMILAAAFNASFLFGEAVDKNEVVKTYNEKRRIPGIKRSRTTYVIIGIVMIALGIAAILNGFLEEKIEF